MGGFSERSLDHWEESEELEDYLCKFIFSSKDNKAHEYFWPLSDVDVVNLMTLREKKENEKVLKLWMKSC